MAQPIRPESTSLFAWAPQRWRFVCSKPELVGKVVERLLSVKFPRRGSEPMSLHVGASKLTWQSHEPLTKQEQDTLVMVADLTIATWLQHAEADGRDYQAIYEGDF